MIRLDRFELRDGAVLVASGDGTQAQGDRSPGSPAVVPEPPLRHRQRVDRSRLSARRPERAGAGWAAGDQGRGARSRRPRPISRSTGSCWAERSRRGVTSTASISQPRTRWSRSPFPERRSAATAGVRCVSTGRRTPARSPSWTCRWRSPAWQLTAKGGADGADVFKLDSRLAVDDLARTGKAAQALTTAAVPAMAGHGDLRLTVEGPLAGAPAGWNAGWKGLFDHLRIGEKHHHRPVDRRPRRAAGEDPRARSS